MNTRKRTKGETTIYKVQHRKLMIEQQESPLKIEVNVRQVVYAVSLKVTVFYVVVTN